MPDYLLLMHDDVPDSGSNVSDAAWEAYFSHLGQSGRFRGGSSIGAGVCVRKYGPVPAVAGHLIGFIRVCAENIEGARALVSGNPVFEAGGTVEIRELPEDE